MGTYKSKYSGVEIDQILNNAQSDHMDVADNKSQISGLNQALTDTKKDLQHQINTLVLESGGDSNLEVVNARADMDSHMHGTLNDRLESDFNKKADKNTVESLQSQVSTNTTKTVDLQSQIDSLVLEAGGDSNPEVVQARTDENGTTHETLKARIDSSVTDLKSDLELVTDNLESVTVAPYAVLEDCQNKRIFDTSIVSGVCDAVAVANGNNLLYVDALTVGTTTLTNGATLIVHEDYTIEYDGTNATSNQMIDVMSNGAWRYVFPFEITLSCEFSDVSNGGFNVNAYYNDGSDHNVGFVNSKLSLPKKSKLFRIYISPNNMDVKFSVKIKINKSDESHAYEKPNLKLIDVGDFKNTVLEEGKNWIFPYSGGWTKAPISTTESIVYLKKIEYKKIHGVHETKTQYETINKALAACDYNNGDYVLVNHGTYNEKIVGRHTPKRIIGFDKDVCIITGTGDNYDNPPIEIAYGIIKNITVIENQSTGAYCLHIDENSIENNTLIIDNCKFVSDGSHAVGIGNRAGSTIIFKNCEFVNSGGSGLPVYMHNTESTGTTLAHMVFDNCIFNTSVGDIALRLQDWSGCCQTEFLFINNTFISNNTAESVNIQYRNYGGVSSESSHIFKNKFTLSSGSHGNNVSYLNYV